MKKFLKEYWLAIAAGVLVFCVYAIPQTQVANAGVTLNTVGFWAYSTANQKVCYLMSGQPGMTSSLSGDASGTFQPNKNFKTLTLGTKGFAQYSASAYGRQLMYDCRTTPTSINPGTAIDVKMYFDGDRSKTFPTSKETISVDNN